MVCNFYWWPHKALLGIPFKRKIWNLQNIKTFHSMIKTQFHTQIQVLRSNNSQEYFHSILGGYLKQNSIIHQSSCVNTPQQNGLAKGKNYHLLKVARSLMFTMCVPKYLWGEVVRHAVWLTDSRAMSFSIIHLCPSSLSLSPEFRSLNSLPLKTFGYLVFIHVHYQNRSKLNPWVIKCVFLGYSLAKRGTSVFLQS